MIAGLGMALIRLSERLFLPLQPDGLEPGCDVHVRLQMIIQGQGSTVLPSWLKSLMGARLVIKGRPMPRAVSAALARRDVCCGHDATRCRMSATGQAKSLSGRVEVRWFRVIGRSQP